MSLISRDAETGTRIDRTAHGKVIVSLFNRDKGYVGRHHRAEWNAWTVPAGERTALTIHTHDGRVRYGFGTVDADGEMRIVTDEGRPIDPVWIDKAFVI